MFLTTRCSRVVSQAVKSTICASADRLTCTSWACHRPLKCRNPNSRWSARLLSTEPDHLAADGKLAHEPLTSIMEKVSALNNPTIYSNLANIKDVGQYLFEMNLTMDQVVTLFSRNPDLCQYPRRNWETSVGFLVGNEVKIASIVRMLVSVPQILDRSAEELEETFACLRRQRLVNRNICALINEAPLLLAVEPEKLEKQFDRLMSVFTRKDILKLVPKCWSTLTDDWSVLEEKLRYIVHVMGVEQPEIVASMALAHPLRHIRLRHQFLLRTGFYTKVRPKKKPKNPRLRVITDTSTRELVEQFVGISMQEFFVFDRMLEQEVLRKEREATADSDADSDDDLGEPSDEHS